MPEMQLNSSLSYGAVSSTARNEHFFSMKLIHPFTNICDTLSSDTPPQGNIHAAMVLRTLKPYASGVHELSSHNSQQISSDREQQNKKHRRNYFEKDISKIIKFIKKRTL